MTRPADTNWATIPLADGHVHVVPLDDGFFHEPEDDCLCGPQVEAVPRPDGSFGWLVSHASLDGREPGSGEHA